MTTTQAKQPTLDASPAHAPAPIENAQSWQTFLIATVSGMLLWLAFPPVGWSWLAWIAPAGWVWLIRLARLPGRRPYWQLYWAGLIHWLLLINWVRLPHWSAYFGWLALSAYLATYLPAFVGLSRVATHRWRLPVIVAAPIVWSGLEYFRGYFLTGFSMGLLGHSQANQLHLIQVADTFGAYGVCFVVIWVAACVGSLIPVNGRPRVVAALGSAALMLAATLGYGHFRLGQTWIDPADPALSVALIQGSMDTTFEEDNRAETLTQYFDLTRQALLENPVTDLVVWPESMYARWWIEYDEPFTPPAESPIDTAQIKAWSQENLRTANEMANMVGRTMLVGSPGQCYIGDRIERFNSAQWLSPGKEPVRYHKMHPVIFGEYVPGGEWFPWLYSLTPMPNGLTPGDSPVALQLGEVTLAPNICFENTVPHLIRDHVCQLTAEGTPPDALVTVTNDGWFWGSSQLDMHLACAVFRSVELRRPLLIAANTGFSAWIDPHGQVVRKGPRRSASVVWAELRRWRGAVSPYQRWGDWGALLCLGLCVMAAWTGWRR